MADVELAQGEGFKLQDASLLSECISNAARWKPSSKLQLFKKNNERQGLAKSLFLRCSSCNAATALFIVDK